MRRRRIQVRIRAARGEREDAERLAPQSESAERPAPSLAPLLKRRGLTASTGEISQLHRKIGNRTLRRMASKESFEAPNRVERILRQEQGRGQSLDGAMQGQMEAAVGADLGSVRIHTDERAAELSSDLSARAFTHGHDIYFAAGEYAPGSEEGQRVLAHELAHVAQGRSAPKLVVGSAYDPAERDADQVADRAVRAMRQQGAQSGMGLRRQVEEEEEELMPLRRQVEEEEEELMPLRRQEEEEEMQLLRRQEEEEEELMPLRRQEEEEELQLIRRQDEEEELPTAATQTPATSEAPTETTHSPTSEEAPAASAPAAEATPASEPSPGRAGAVVALWGSAVVTPVRQAVEILGGSGPLRDRATRATDLVVSARSAIGDMHQSYRDQPELYGRLAWGQERLNTLFAALTPYTRESVQVSEINRILGELAPWLEETGGRL